MKKSKTGWAIKNELGHLLVYTVQPTRKMCIEEYTRGNKQFWARVKKLGAQCVKVKITEL